MLHSQLNSASKKRSYSSIDSGLSDDHEDLVYLQPPTKKISSISNQSSSSSSLPINTVEQDALKTHLLKNDVRLNDEILELSVQLLSTNSNLPQSNDSDNTTGIFIGREEESSKLEQHFQKIINTGIAFPIYVCGTPGAGKSALIAHQIEKFKKIGAAHGLDNQKIENQNKIVTNDQISNVDHETSLTLSRSPNPTTDVYDDQKSSNNSSLNRLPILAPYHISMNCATDFITSASNNSRSTLFTIIYERLCHAFDNSEVSRITNHKFMKQAKRAKKSTGYSEDDLNELLHQINEIHKKYIQIQLSLDKKTETAKENQSGISIPSKPIFVIFTIDEIDHLLKSSSRHLTNTSKELRYLFGLFSQPFGILAIVAIANSYQLVDNYLHNNHLAYYLDTLNDSQSRKIDLKSLVLQFKPYTSEQLESLLVWRLSPLIGKLFGKQADPSKRDKRAVSLLFDDKAIRFLAIKTSKLAGDQAGDARIFLDIAKSAVVSSISSTNFSSSSQSSQPSFPVTLQYMSDMWKLKMNHFVTSMTNLSSNPTTEKSKDSSDSTVAERPENPSPSNPSADSSPSISHEVNAITQLTLLQKAALLCMLRASNALNQKGSSTVQHSAPVRSSLLESTWKKQISSRSIFLTSKPEISDFWATISLLEGIGHVIIDKKSPNRETYQLKSPNAIIEGLKQDLVFKEFIHM